MKNRLVLFLFVVLFGYNGAFAGGFQINEHNARAMALGGAFTAIVNDPSAVYFNPGALTRLAGLQIMLGTTFIAPSTSFRGPSPSIGQTDLSSKIFYPSHIYGSYQVDDNWFVGIGMTNPFGLGTTWDEKWVGRFVSIETDLKTFVFNPTVAYKFNDQFSVGVGLTYSFASVTIKKATRFTPFEGEGIVTLDGNDPAGWGFTAGILYTPTQDLSFGLSFRSEVHYALKGTVSATGPAQLEPNLPKGDIVADLNTPQQFTFGIGYRILPELTLSGDFQYIFWSSYKELRAAYQETNETLISSPRNYENTYIARLGLEYNLDKDFALRAGVLYDNSPAVDEYVDASLPDASRFGFSTGLGYNLSNNFTVDLSYMFLRFSERTVTTSKIDYSGTSDGLNPFNGTYNSTASLVSLSFRYHL